MWSLIYLFIPPFGQKVPLDYSRPDGPSAAIAMIRIHSGVSHDSPDYRGPILINPGGPGVSGVDTVMKGGSLISTIVGPQFDIIGSVSNTKALTILTRVSFVIGFDPRGESTRTL
jgi:hypothetical protein